MRMLIIYLRLWQVPQWLWPTQLPDRSGGMGLDRHLGEMPSDRNSML